MIARVGTHGDPIGRNESYSPVTRFEVYRTIFITCSNLQRRHRSLRERRVDAIAAYFIPKRGGRTFLPNKLSVSIEYR